MLLNWKVWETGQHPGNDGLELLKDFYFCLFGLFTHCHLARCMEAILLCSLTVNNKGLVEINIHFSNFLLNSKFTVALLTFWLLQFSCYFLCN